MKFKITRNGLLRGGEITTQYNPDFEILWISLKIIVGFGLFYKELNFTHSEKIPKILMMSDNFFIGKKFSNSNIDFIVTEYDPELKTATLYFSDLENEDGLLFLDINGYYVELIGLVMRGTYAGTEIKIEAKSIG